MLQRLFLIISLAGFLALLGSPAVADPVYNATPLTVPNGFQPIVEGLNNNGQVLLWNTWAPTGAPSYSLYNSQAGGTITTLATNGSSTPDTQFTAQYMSGNGNIVGYVNAQPVLYSGGQYTSLPGWGQAVNDSGQVAYNSGQNAYIVTNGTITNLGSVPGYETTTVNGINNAGQAALTGAHVGSGGGNYESQPLFYNGQHLVPLGTFGGTNGYSVAVNNQGDLIGAATNSSGGYIGFVSHNGGPLVSLGTLPGSWGSQPESINDKGQIVGAAQGLSGGGAFLFQSGTLLDLNKLLSPSASNIHLVDAYAINNAGDIIAEGYLKSPFYSQLQLFFLTPDGQPIALSPDPLIQINAVPEPSTLALCGLIVAGMLARRRWGRGRSSRSHN
jgi:probable HAF family extracellular repeat protein